jgi:hypothetical protein
VAKDRREQRHCERIGEAMRELGWQRKKFTVHQRRVWGYFKGDPDQWLQIHRDPESGQISVGGVEPFRLSMTDGEPF